MEPSKHECRRDVKAQHGCKKLWKWSKEFLWWCCCLNLLHLFSLSFCSDENSRDWSFPVSGEIFLSLKRAFFLFSQKRVCSSIFFHRFSFKYWKIYKGEMGWKQGEKFEEKLRRKKLVEEKRTRIGRICICLIKLVRVFRFKR